MRRVLACLLLLAAPAFAASKQDYGAVSATDENTAVTFADDTTAAAFYAASVWVKNDDTTNEAWICFTGSTASATACGFQLKAGESITVNFPNDEGQNAMGVICSSGETATVRYLAIR